MSCGNSKTRALETMPWSLSTCLQEVDICLLSRSPRLTVLSHTTQSPATPSKSALPCLSLPNH